MSIPNFSKRLSRSSTATFRDVEMEHRPHFNELRYSLWWSRERVFECLQTLPNDALWNSMICSMALAAIVWEACGIEHDVVGFLDVLYNILYAIHVLGSAYNVLLQLEVSNVDLMTAFGYILDIISYSHYVIFLNEKESNRFLKLICYYFRLNRPFRYFWSLNNYTMKGSVIGTTLMYCYIFLVLRITWALIWLHIDKFEQEYSDHGGYRRALPKVQQDMRGPGGKLGPSDEPNVAFLSALYIVNKMFIPIGPSIAPRNDIERITCLLVMITGCLVVTGAAVASLSLVFSIYMRPEESFRARYRMIIKEMVSGADINVAKQFIGFLFLMSGSIISLQKESHVPPGLREKVETFYKIYWHKQRAVSSTELLPNFPPTLPATIYTDIYFKATQKSRILRDLSYQFLSEVAKGMRTIHYIPGDTIIRRTTKKSSIIYITYGDVEMLTAEDDSTAILRMTRGTILSPCAPCPVAGCARAHVEIRAATFCTAHVLKAIDLWKIVVKHGRENHQGAIILSSFDEHFERVKRHFFSRTQDYVKYKSSILHFKRNLMNIQESRDDNGDYVLSHADVMLKIAGCYVQRNRTNSSMSDEADAICLRSTFPCILQPNSSLQVAWNGFVACVITVVCITHPYNLVYKKEPSLGFRFYDYVVTAIYALDLMAHLSTGANVEDGAPITLAQTSSQQARSRWFVLAVLGTLPIFEFIGEGHFAGINKLLRLPKVFRVLKAMEEECVYYSNVLRFLSFSLIIMISCYLIAALQHGFMCFQFGFCRVSNFTHEPHWEAAASDDETVRDSLLFSLYWSISMLSFTTHMETFGSENWKNILYTMLVLEICIVLHIFIEAVYSATIMVTTAMRENFDAGIEVVKHFLARNEVESVLRERFITYLQLSWYNDKAYATSSKKSTIFHDLPPHVYQDIVMRQRSKYILCIPFMKLLHRDDLRNVSSSAKMFYTAPNEILLNTGDITNEMYVIKQGICEILSPETKSTVGELGARNHFGVLECLLRLPAFYTIRAVTHVQVFCISRKYLMNALKIPKINDAIEFAKQQPEYSSLLVRRMRFESYHPEKPPPSTERFRLPRKHEEDSIFLQPFNKLGFLSVLRYIFPRFTIRPDGQYLVRCEWLRATCALFSAMLFPGYAYLVLQLPWLYYATLLLDFTAYFDLFQRMLVGYYNDKGILVYHPSSTAAHYLKGAFMVDLFACLPLEFLETPWIDLYHDTYSITITKQVLMLNRLVQLYRTSNALIGLVKYIRRDILLVIQAIPLFIALINILTCFMVLYSAKISYSVEDRTWYIFPHSDKGDSWIELFKNVFRYDMAASPWNLHLTCLFWVIYETTTTGYNCFNPSNAQLMQVLLSGMVIGNLIITYYSVRIISIRANVNKLLAAFQQDMKDMTAFMKGENLSVALQREVLDYYRNDWEKMGGTDYRNILKLCDQVTLRSDAILNIFGPTFMKCPILTQCHVSLLRMMGRAIRSYHFLKGTEIVEVDDVIGEVYLVDQGRVEITEYEDNVKSITVLSKGSIFGNLNGPSTIRCPVSVIAKSRVHLLRINAQVFHNIIKDFPNVMNLIDKYRAINKNYIEGVVPNISSYLKERSFISPMVPRYRRISKVLHFSSPYIQLFYIFISLSCIYADVYNAGFIDNRFWLIVALYFHDLAFCWKFLIQYMLPYSSEESDDVISELSKIRKAYFKGEFKYDILSCLPIEAFCFLSHGNRWTLFAWLRLNRVLRIVTVYTCLKRYHKHFFINLSVTTTFSVLIWFTLFIHFSTCLWYFIGVMEEATAPKTSWFYTDEGAEWCNNKYVCSLYFILTTFTQNGVGDILPKKQAEVIFVSILQIVSTMVYMMYVGELSNLIQYQSFRSFSYYCKYLDLQEFLKNNRVSRNLMKMVNKYTHHLWRESRGVQVPHFLETAPNCLKLKVMSAAYLHHLTRHHIFECCEAAFLRQLVGHLRLYTYNKGTYVVKQSEITNSMYIIHTGRVAETQEINTKSKVYFSEEYFGVAQGLITDYPHTHSYRCTSKSQILTLRLDDWEYLLNHFPNSKECIFKFLEYDDNSSDGKEKDKPTKTERKVTISERVDARWRKVKTNYVNVKDLDSNSTVHSKASTSANPTETAMQKLEKVKSKEVQYSNFETEENIIDNIDKYKVDIDQSRTKTSFADLFDERTENVTGENRERPASKSSLNIEESEVYELKDMGQQNVEKSAAMNETYSASDNAIENDDVIILKADSKSSIESDSKTSINETRQSERDKPSK